MAKELTTNVFVPDLNEEGVAYGGGTYYGPDYPENKVTQDVLDRITNPAAFAEVAEPIDPHSEEAAVMRSRHFESESTQTGYSDEELEGLSKKDLLAVAAVRNVDVPARAKAEQIVELLKTASAPSE